jgi:ribosomal protein S18 acetylase RimI-like enzyme
MPDEKPPNLKLYRSDLSDIPVSIRDARIAIISKNEVSKRPPFRGHIRIADLSRPADLDAVEAINDFHWGCMEQDVFGRTYKVLDCDNLLALPMPDEPDATEPSNHGIAGNVAIVNEADFLHIVVFHVWPIWRGRGVGRKLLDAAADEALRRGFKCVKLGTTNDNIPALYFYQRVGFALDGFAPCEAAPGHPMSIGGFAGIPISDEITLRMNL